jgi:hypothetical protein
MKFKSKFFLFFLILLFILFVLGVIRIEKKILFLNQKTQQFGKSINELNSRIAVLIKREEFLTTGLELSESETSDIKSKSNIYNIKTFNLPFLRGKEWIGIPAAYLEQTDNEIIFASSSGEFFSFKKKDIGFDNLDLKKIRSNIKNVIKNEEFYSDGFVTIKDLLILNNKIFFSYIKKLTNNCYNTSIMSSEFNLNYLKFTEFFSYEDCIVGAHGALWNSGGRMIPFKDGKILLSTGVMTQMLLAQNTNSMFGKIISIDLKTKEFEMVSMGHRNPQGLFYDQNLNIIINTEHGPTGGDEININFNPDNETIENYGWPISTYGKHTEFELKTSTERYENKLMKDISTHKSHKDFGFIEPIKYFVPSIAISEIIKIPKTFNEKFMNDFFIGALGYKGQIDQGDQSIHHIRFNDNFDKIIFEDVIPIGERIRDIIFVKEKNILLLVLESIPAIGVLKLAN